MNTQQNDSHLQPVQKFSYRSKGLPDDVRGDESLLLETDYLAYEDDDQVIDEHIRGYLDA